MKEFAGPGLGGIGAEGIGCCGIGVLSKRGSEFRINGDS